MMGLASVLLLSAILRVGPGEAFSRPSQAAAVAKSGDVVEIAAGEYRGDACAWTADDLTIRGAGPSATVLTADGACCRGKGIWVVTGRRASISGIAFTGAECADRNGAGIRAEGTDLTVSNCIFRANENGILSGADPTSDIRIVRCVFRANGAGDGCSHNVYIGKVRSLAFVACVSDHANRGHCLKSRALRTVVRDCVFDDGEDGISSYLADFPNGGDVTVERCHFVQSAKATNGTMVAIGEEGAYADTAFTETGNTFVDHRGNGTRIKRNF